MAYVIGANAIVEVTFEGLHEGQQVMSTYHYKMGTPATVPDGYAVLGELLTKVMGGGELFETWREAISVHVTDLVVSAQWIKPNRYRYRFDIPAIDSGGIAGDCNPTNVAIAITRLGEAANRHNQGTLHMPGVPLSFIDNSALQPAGAGLYSSHATVMLQDFVLPASGAEMIPVLFNKVNYLLCPRMTAAQIQNYARVMRRRTVGVGS